jgi:hypothetical protein
MSNIREVLDKLAFDAGVQAIRNESEGSTVVDEAELAINKIVEDARRLMQGNYICDYCNKGVSIHFLKSTYDGDAKPNGRICLDCLNARASTQSNKEGELKK